MCIKMAEIEEIPRNAEKVQFAEDLVNYVLHQNTGAEIKPFRVEGYRDFIHDRFNDTVRKAITYLDSTMTFIQDDVDALMCNHDVVNGDTYQMYAETVYEKYFYEEFDACLFLNYCTELAKTAAYLYNNGVSEAPTIAILNIIRTFETVDMNTAEWDIVNDIAKKLTSITRIFLDELSLKPVESCDVGEDEDMILANIKVPQNAEKVLFAEELVYQVMLWNSKVQILPSRVKRYQDNIKPRFTETTRQAIEFLNNKIKIDTDVNISVQNQKKLFHTDMYKLKAELVRYIYFPVGFELSNFLEYCVHIASLAALFYNKGVPEAPSLAILNIVSVISEYDMSAGGWSALNKSAGQYAIMDKVSQMELMPSSQDSYDIAKGMVKQKASPNKNDVVEPFDDWENVFREAELNEKIQKDYREFKDNLKCNFTQRGSPDSKTSNEKIPQECEPRTDSLGVLLSLIPEDASSVDISDVTVTKHAPTSKLCEQTDTDEISTQLYICEVLQKRNSSCDKISVNEAKPSPLKTEKQPESTTDLSKCESFSSASVAEN